MSVGKEQEQEIEKMVESKLNSSEFEDCKIQVERKYRHIGIVCAACGEPDFVGVRYKSVTRPDYNLCEICEANDESGDLYLSIRDAKCYKPKQVKIQNQLIKFQTEHQGIYFGRHHPLKNLAIQVYDPPSNSGIVKSAINVKKAALLNPDSKIRKRTLVPGSKVEAWWEVKNLHFKKWGNTTLRCLNNSDLLIPPVKIEKQLEPMQTQQIRASFYLPEDIVKDVKNDLYIHLCLFDEDYGEHFGEDLCIKLSFE